MCPVGGAALLVGIIDAEIIPPVINLLANAEFDIKKEAAWSISNATSGGSPQQIKYLVQQGCIPPLCDLLTVADAKIVTVALEGLENILKVGEQEGKQIAGGHNQMATFIAEAEGLTKIEALQQHDNNDIYAKAIKILETYFGVDDEEDVNIAPAADGAQFGFGVATGPAAGGAQQPFNFGPNPMG